MSLPVRTPRQGRTSRGRPNGRAGHSGALPTRQASSGLFGTLRSVVTAPLSWFGPRADSSLDAVGDKRRHHSPPGSGSETDTAPQPSKRARHHSPPRRHEAPIGDPPPSFFPAPVPPTTLPARTRSSASPARSSLVVRTHSAVVAHNPLGPRPPPAGLERQMSIDAPGLLPKDPFARASGVFARAGSMTHGLGAMAHPQSPSRPRANMTSHPSGAVFGPLPPRRLSRDPSAPPLLAGTIESRRSPFKSSLARSSSAMSFTAGSNHISSVSSAPSPADLSHLPWNKRLTTAQDVEAAKQASASTLNAADIALQKLEAYRTPLLPSRPNASSPSLDRLRPKKVHVPIPMPDHFGDEWGKSTRDKNKLDPKTARMVHPYGGESGLKRLLARQRNGIERKEIAIGTDPEVPALPPAKKAPSPVVSRKASVMEVDDEDKPKSQLLPAPAKERQSAPATRPQTGSSSLRAPKAITKRTHQSTKNKFSANIDDDDDGLAGLPTEEELLAAKPMEFKIPEGFSFKPSVATKVADAMDTTSSTATMSTLKPDTSAIAAFAVKPIEQPAPIPTMSFPTAPAPVLAPAAPVSSSFFAIPPPAASGPSPFEMGKSQSIPASIFSSSFSSAHPKEDNDNPMGSESKKSQENKSEEKKTIPTFFNVPSVALPTAPKVPDFGVSGGAVPGRETTGTDTDKPIMFPPKEKVTSSEPPKPLFGLAPTNGENNKASTFSFPAIVPASAPSDKPSFSFSSTPSLPTPSAEKSGFSFGPLPTAETAKSNGDTGSTGSAFGSFKPATETPAPPFTFTGFGKPAPTSTPSEPPKSFSFGTPVSAEKTGDTAKPKTPDNSGEMRMEESPERGGPQGSSTQPPLFGGTTTTTAFNFGAGAKSDSTPAFGGSTPTSSFNFAAPSGTESKPLFGAPSTGFSFGGNSTAESAKPSAPSFSFGSTPSESTKSGAFAFGQTAENKPAASTTPFSFGATDTSKPAATSGFGFGTTDSSKPTLSFGSQPPATGGFAFGAPKLDTAAAPRDGSPFSAPASPFAAPTSPFAAPANPFGSTASAAPQSPATSGAPSFTFGVGAPMNNPFATASAGSPANGGGFTIGAPDPSQREKKPMPRRRPQTRR